MSKSLALFAFESLVSELESSKRMTLAEVEKRTKSETALYPQNAPLFVTWNKDGNLRGCIGTFLNTPVEAGVAQYALISAFEDTRFAPIKFSELPSLSVGITLLDNFEEVLDPQDWVIGKHGLKVLFTDQGRRYLGTFLPLVAVEQEWTSNDTLWNLLRKSGSKSVSPAETTDFYASAIAAGTMRLVRYEGLKCSASYHEYKCAMSQRP
ncbi:hypothetical protein METBIDRAFT_46473 [Metschnikowia bicuspidata var. bicuspidata NRRL YB-4993]|uniref:AMMECR1 domain-containing protein n=1 Tax=Metschnikowia bicuspidata var. bicuspidata NRRL YB-4993 TaxID=869754 RepID=A0A1A0H5T6_9ASCO|nr:hypothetical protein METBIDRAFT_46473 [Metschnikowia bicuspidata var. bicuspidata NRRL YB-4993]OBA19278.1 hypothetical protein METBIDRAFT_46473 [Metschnikowia bicuspidata var. bicuspidata NRRL YB-4993]